MVTNYKTVNTVMRYYTKTYVAKTLSTKLVLVKNLLESRIVDSIAEYIQRSGDEM